MLGLLLVGACSVRVPEKKKPAEAEARTPDEAVEEAAPAPALPPETRPAALPAPRPHARAPTLSPLRASGTSIVDTNGLPVILKGCNLGNWLLLEMWMLDTDDVPDQYAFESVLAQRFGADEAERLMELYRANWITRRDFPIIRSFGFNVVRLPFNYRLLEDDARPFQLRENAFAWLDRAVRMAAAEGLYTILDLHGAPGGQSPDHTTGRAGQNQLWGSGECRQRTAWLWKQVAEHFKDEPAVAAYDVLNEPDSGDKSGRPEFEVFDLIYHSIRSVDPNHIVFAPAHREGVEFYGAPAQRGWSNVGFTEHFYPGLFGHESEGFEPHELLISRVLPQRAALLERWQAPFLVGEFNVVFRNVGGPALMRKYYDLYGTRGWAATMWSYKLVKKNGGPHEDSWGMVKNLEPAPPFSVRTSGKEQIESFFRWLGTNAYSFHENLGAALTMKEAPPAPGLEYPLLPSEPEAVDALPAGWEAADIGGALPGGQKVLSPSAMEIFAGGEDIWYKKDQFRFVFQRPSGDFTLTATISGLTESHQYAKAGLMLRSGPELDAAHVMINVFPSGHVLLASRGGRGFATEQQTIASARFPVGLRLERRGSRVTAGFSDDGKTWSNRLLRVSSSLTGGGCAGLVVLSHDNRCLTSAAFKDIEFISGPGRR